ncbi:hypothetical protein EMCRGX_G018695 [Ephydatia muelleri]
MIVNLTFDDLNAAKARSISAGYTLSIAAGMVQDMAGNPLPAITAIGGPFIVDTTIPTLISFDLLMVQGLEPLLIILRFSETVRANTISATYVTVYSSVVNATSFTLTAGQVSTTNSPNITITVTSNDLSQIRSLAPLLQYNNTSYLAITTGNVFDMSNNNLPLPQVRLPVGNYSADLTRPFVSRFSLDMNIGILTITFSKNVRYTTLSPAVVSLQVSSNSTPFFLPLSAVQTNQNGTNVVINISNIELNGIKRLPPLATSVSTTYMAIGAGLVDTAGNSLLPILSTNAVQAQTLIPDTTPPTLTGFLLNMNNGSIVFTFSETVNVSTIVPGRIDVFNGLGDEYTLTGGFSNQLFSDVVVFNLSHQDLNNIKGINNLATAINNTFLDLRSQAVLDMNRNPNVDAFNVPASGFVKDNENPILDAYSVDMNAGKLVLSFDETVDITSMVVSQLVLSSGTQAYNLTFFAGSVVPSPTVTILINTSDLNQLKLRRICLTAITCYLSFPSTFIRDRIGRPVIPVLLKVPFPFTPDSTSPALVDFSQFSITSGAVTLLFSEPVQASTFDASQVTFQTFFVSDATTKSYTLHSGTVTSPDGTVLQFNLTSSDMMAIQALGSLCDRRGDCYILLTPTTVKDISGNWNDPVLQIFPGKVVTVLVSDTTPPVLTGFDLNMNTGMLTLSFSEPVGTLDPTTITIASGPNANASQQYTLTGGAQNYTSGQAVIYLTLSPSDLNAVKSSSFAKQKSNTYLAMSSGAVYDLSYLKNALVAIPISKPVLTYSIVFANVSLQNSPYLPSFMHNLVGGAVLNPYSSATSLLISMLQYDITAIKLASNFGTTSNNTVINVSAGAFTDTAGNPSSSAILTASIAVQGTTLPRLLAFGINMQTGSISLTFSDVMLSSTLDTTAITIQNSPYAKLSNSVTLSALNSSSPNGFVIVFTLSPLDIFYIQSTYGLAVNQNSTYLTMQAFGITNAYGTNVLAITNGKALQVSNYTADTQPLSFVSFLLDRNTGDINITFSKVADYTQLNVTLLALLSDRIPTIRFNVGAGATVGRSADGRTVQVRLVTTDLNSLKLNPALGTSTSNTFLIVGPNAIPDIFGNLNVQGVPVTSALQATNVINDTLGPTLLGFTINFSTRTMAVTFSEPVMSSTFNTNGFILQSKRDLTYFPQETYILKTGTTTSLNGVVLNITFGKSDVDAINALTFPRQYNPGHLPDCH